MIGTGIIVCILLLVAMFKSDKIKEQHNKLDDIQNKLKK